MSKLSFDKYEGIGNDFILIDDRDPHFPIDPLLIQKLCHRKFGIGADGLILLQRGVDFRMRIFNCDGTEPESCGNALRCLVHFLKELGLFQESVRIEIHDRVVLARWIDGYPAVDMGPPTHISLHLKTDDGTFHFAHCGVPHAVQFVPDVEQVDLNLLGPRIRFHPLFSPKGANVDFAALQNDGSIRVRTFERGVEKETLACGTGAAAVAAIARELYGLKQQIPIHFRGGTLMMDGNWMIGPVRRVFSGGTGIG